MAQLRLQKSFLEPFLRPPPRDPNAGPTAPREAAAGLPKEAAEVLIMSQADPTRPVPWLNFPSHLACLAAALRLFGRLIPSQESLAGASELLCQSPPGVAPGQGSGDCAEQLAQLATALELPFRQVAAATESLEVMLRNKPAACFAFLESYVAVAEDSETQEEVEHEVGQHCVLVVGGDLLSPSFVVFDPWGAKGGEVSHWQQHSFDAAKASLWVELSVPLTSKAEPAPATME